MSCVMDYGARGDGKTDDTEALQHAVDEGDGIVRLPRGDYKITKTIEIPLDTKGRHSIDGSGGTAKVIMAGPGPAFRFTGTHAGTGNPKSARPNIWTSQRFPTIHHLEIEGAHPEADGVEMFRTMQCVFESVLIRKVRNGIRLFKRNRNVLICHCHVYDNTGIGVYLDGVDLHQINISDNHISYNGLGGIRIERSAIRNLQITGNDIEYNNQQGKPTGEIYIDCSDPRSSVEEVTVASNTIQATVSPGGANVRIFGGPESRRPGMWAISGNIIGSQENNVHLSDCHGVVLTGNFIYSCLNRNVLVENSSQVTLGSNNFRRHTPRLGTGVRFVKSRDCTISGCHFQDEAPDGQASKASLLELDACDRFTLSGCQLLDGVPYGIDAQGCSRVNISGCTVMDTREAKKSRSAIRFSGKGTANLVATSSLGKGLDSSIAADPASGVTMTGNLKDL